MGIGLEPREERGPGLLKRATSPRTTQAERFLKTTLETAEYTW